MKLFYYKQETPDGETLVHAFNLEKLIRMVEVPEGIVVLLDDMHERVKEVPTISNSGKQKGTQRIRETVQTEILITDKEDIKNFRKL